MTVTGEGVIAQAQDFAADVRAGLTASPKSLPCRWFYDAAGARIFEEICDLPEYYLTRAEEQILATHAREIVGAFPPGATLVELGSGNARKTRILIEELLRREGRVRYVPIDISRPTLESAGRALVAEYPALEFAGIASEYHEGLRSLAGRRPDGPLVVLWMGSNAGNFDRPAAAEFLRGVRATMAPDDRLLLGVDLRKDARTLVAAYDDSKGVTARFNLNLLARVNRELGGEFDLAAFRHVASYDDGPGRIQMHLVSTKDQRIPIRGLDLEVVFQAGERIHTEDSYKYSLEEIDGLANAGGFRPENQWLDASKRFAVTLLDRRLSDRRL
jgi:dimethylhistidine N-methyltransferase